MAEEIKGLTTKIQCELEWVDGHLTGLRIVRKDLDVDMTLTKIGEWGEVLGGFVLGTIEGYKAGREDGVKDAESTK